MDRDLSDRSLVFTERKSYVKVGSVFTVVLDLGSRIGQKGVHKSPSSRHIFLNKLSLLVMYRGVFISVNFLPDCLGSTQTLCRINLCRKTVKQYIKEMKRGRIRTRIVPLLFLSPLCTFLSLPSSLTPPPPLFLSPFLPPSVSLSPRLHLSYFLSVTLSRSLFFSLSPPLLPSLSLSLFLFPSLSLFLSLYMSPPSCLSLSVSLLSSFSLFPSLSLFPPFLCLTPSLCL